MTSGAPGGSGAEKEPSFGGSLRTFTLRVLLATVLAVAVVLLALRWWGPSGEKPASAPPAADRAGPRPGSGARATPPPAPAASAVAITETGRDVERRRAAGALSEAHKRFARCPGGDLERLAWIDARAGVVKLLRRRDDGVTLEEWFDDEGRLREAVWQGRGAAGSWGRRVALDERGRETAEDLAGGAVPDAPPPALDRGDPTAAFFALPSCGR
jgi:hypothetical protein